MRKPGISRTPEIEIEILARLAEGEGLNGICRDERLPSESTVRGWVVDDAEFAAKYARVRDIGTDCRAERLREIAADENIPVEHKRYIIDVEKWLASKIAPKRYGDRVAVDGTLSGPGGGPVQSVVELRFVDGVSPE
jgi:hypothetical protein